MTDTLSQNAERLRQLRTARAGNFLADASTRAGNPLAATGTLIAGSAVFDTLTGLDAEVVNVVRSGDGASADVELVLSDGRHVMRRPDLLIVPPTRPGATK